MRVPVKKISFTRHAVAHLTVEQFVEKFSPVYPAADLVTYAKELGLVNAPAATVKEAPAITPKTTKRSNGNRRSDDEAL